MSDVPGARPEGETEVSADALIAADALWYQGTFLGLRNTPDFQGRSRLHLARAIDAYASRKVAEAREPTRDMKLAANAVPIKRYGWVHNGTSEPMEIFAVTGQEAEDIWKAMIDAALGRGK